MLFRSPNCPCLHLHLNNLTAPSALRRQSHGTNHPLNLPSLRSRSGVPSLTLPRKILSTQRSPPTHRPIALIRTLQAESRAGLVTEALPQRMGAMTFQRKLPFCPLHLLWVSMQTVPYHKTRLPRTTVLLFACNLHIPKTPVALCLPLRLVLAQMSAQVKTTLRPLRLLQRVQ